MERFFDILISVYKIYKHIETAVLAMVRASHLRSESCGFDSGLHGDQKHFSEFEIKLEYQTVYLQFTKLEVISYIQRFEYLKASKSSKRLCIYVHSSVTLYLSVSVSF